MSASAPALAGLPFGWGAVWGTINAVGIGGIIVALIKVWPKIKELANVRETGALAARGEDMDDMRKRISDLEAKVEMSATAMHSAEMKLVYAVSAVQLLAARIRADNPDDPALLQAMELLSAATTGGLPSWGAKLGEQLGKIRASE